jgi:hypothetical protein
VVVEMVSHSDAADSQQYGNEKSVWIWHL